MSEHRLPENLDAWPADPYKLLGIKAGVDRRTLRVAYTALLRAFRPEEYPEHFRRLRQAYETVLQRVAWQEERTSPPVNVEPFAAASAPAPPPASMPPVNTAPADLDAPRQSSGPAPPSWHDQIDAAWEEALAGGQDAYLRLAALEPQSPQRRAICLRLYWLLVVWPELDPQREAVEWLTHGLPADGLAGPLAELYFRHIDAEPTEALTPRCKHLLQCPAAPAALADMLCRRWQAVGRLNSFVYITADIERFRERFPPAVEQTWCQLLLAAINQLAWSQSAATQTEMNDLIVELEKFEHLNLSLRESLDRVDLLRAVTYGWRYFQSRAEFPDDLLPLVRLAWLRPWHEIESRAMRLVAEIGANPFQALGLFDRIAQASRPLLGQIGQIIQSCQPGAPNEKRQRPEQIRYLARLVIDSHYVQKYLELRPHLLSFCIREQVDPAWVVNLPGEPFVHPIEAHNAFVQQVINDAALQLAYFANRALRG